MTDIDFMDEVIEINEQVAIIIKSLLILHPEEGKIIYAVLGGTSVSEYAEKTGKSVNTCAMTYRRAVKKLKKAIDNNV